MPTSENRKITSVSFDKILWANFRSEAKRRGELVQDVFDRLMASYVTGQPNRLVLPNRENTNVVKEEAHDEQEEGDEIPEDDLDEEEGFAVEPHLPGFVNSELIEVDESQDEDDEDWGDSEEKDAEEEEGGFE